MTLFRTWYNSGMDTNTRGNRTRDLPLATGQVVTSSLCPQPTYYLLEDALRQVSEAEYRAVTETPVRETR